MPTTSTTHPQPPAHLQVPKNRDQYPQSPRQGHLLPAIFGLMRSPTQTPGGFLPSFCDVSGYINNEGLYGGRGGGGSSSWLRRLCSSRLLIEVQTLIRVSHFRVLWASFLPLFGWESGFCVCQVSTLSFNVSQLWWYSHLSPMAKLLFHWTSLSPPSSLSLPPTLQVTPFCLLPPFPRVSTSDSWVPVTTTLSIKIGAAQP